MIFNLAGRKKIGFLLAPLLLFLIVLCHYLVWVNVADPLPEHGGKFEYYYPVLNYLHVADRVGNDLNFIRTCDFEYSYGVSLLSWLVVECGLSDIISARPFLLNIVCLLPFVFCIFCFRGGFERRFLTGLMLCFFPFAQICIKQFSLHGLAVSCAFLALLLFRSWIACKRRYLLIPFVFLFWFATLLKLSGLLLVLNTMVIYVFWSMTNRCFSGKILLLLFLPLLLALPFYDSGDLFSYITSSLWHNPYIAAHPFAGGLIFGLCALGLLLLPPLSAIYLRSRDSFRGTVPKIFRYKALFILLLFCACAVVIGDLFSPFLIGIFGYGFLCPFLWSYRFRGGRGFIYLYAFLTLVPMLMLYRSGVGRMSYVIFVPLLLMLVQFIMENDSRTFRILLLILILSASNFFPSFTTLDRLFGRYGREFYLTLFHGPHQNPLGWHNYGFALLKREFVREMATYSFPEKPLFIVENFGPFTSAQFAFYPNVLYQFPPLPILELLEEGRVYKELYHRYVSEREALFDDLFEIFAVPVLFFAENQPLNERGFIQLPLEELISDSEFSIEKEHDDFFVLAFNQGIINYFKSSGRLDRDYVCREIPLLKPMATLCVDKRAVLSENQTAIDYGKLYLAEIVARRVQELLNKAWGKCHEGEPETAHRWLKAAAEMDPDSEELKRDMEEMAQILWDEYAYNIYRERLD